MGRSDLQKLLDEKKTAKKHLFDECWPDHSRGARQATAAQQPDADIRLPLVIIFTTKEKSNHELVFHLLEGLLVLPIQVLVVSDQDPGEHHKKHSGKVMWFNPQEGQGAPKLDQWIMAADMAVVFDEKMATFNTLFDKGVVPIAHEKSPLVANYHPNEETGNSFTYSEKNPWGVFAALVRACETFHFPYDWQHIIRGILKVR